MGPTWANNDNGCVEFLKGLSVIYQCAKFGNNLIMRGSVLMGSGGKCFDGLKVVKIPAISYTSMSVKVCANSRRDGVCEGF